MNRPSPAHLTLAACAVASVGFALQPASSDAWLLVYDVVAVATLAVFAASVHRIDRRGRSVWLLLLVAQGTSILGDIQYDITQLRSLDATTTSDLAYAVSAVVRLAALVVLVRRRSPGRNGVVWVDSALIGTSVMALLAVYALAPLYDAAGGVPDHAVFTTSFLVLDVLALAVMVRLVVSATAVPSRALWLVLAAQALFMMSDIAYTLTTLTSADESVLPGAVQAGWLVSYVLFAYAASRSDAAAITDPGPASPPRFHPLGFLAVALLTLVVPTGIVGLLAADDHRSLALLTIANLVIVSLLLARSYLLLRISQEQSDHLAQLARTDPLTGLANRRRWEHVLRRSVAMVGILDDPVVVAMGDLDNFKEYNDRYGHPAGDALLQKCAAAWAAALPIDGFIARLGGDEFAVILHDHTAMTALPVLERLLAGTPEAVTLSLGVTECHPGVSAEQVTSNADIALYAAKRSGRNRIEFFDRGWDLPLDGPPVPAAEDRDGARRGDDATGGPPSDRGSSSPGR
jgi:diguanylate cyclase (GGDEF)-like protein